MMSRPFLPDDLEPSVFATPEGHGLPAGVCMHISLEALEESLSCGLLEKCLSKKNKGR